MRKKILLDLVLIAGLSGALFWLNVYSSIPDQLTVASEEKKAEVFQNIFPDWLEETVVADSRDESNIPAENLMITENADTEKNSYVVECSLFGTIPVKK